MNGFEEGTLNAGRWSRWGSRWLVNRIIGGDIRRGSRGVADEELLPDPSKRGRFREVCKVKLSVGNETDRPYLIWPPPPHSSSYL